MKTRLHSKILAFFFLTIFCHSLAALEQPTCGKTFYATLDRCDQYLDVRVLPPTPHLLHDIFLLREPLLVELNEDLVSESPLPYGFLFPSSPNPERTQAFLEAYQAKIIAAYLDGNLVGFLVLTDISLFINYYCESPFRSFDCLEKETIEHDFHTKRLGFITEIAVKQGYCNKGIGTALIDVAKSLRPDGLIADIYIYPMVNTPSLSFFAKKAFREIGTCEQEKTDDSIHLKTRVLYWTPHV